MSSDRKNYILILIIAFFLCSFTIESAYYQSEFAKSVLQGTENSFYYRDTLTTLYAIGQTKEFTSHIALSVLPKPAIQYISKCLNTTFLYLLMFHLFSFLFTFRGHVRDFFLCVFPFYRIQVLMIMYRRDGKKRALLIT